MQVQPRGKKNCKGLNVHEEWPIHDARVGGFAPDSSGKAAGTFAVSCCSGGEKSGLTSMKYGSEGMRADEWGARGEGVGVNG